MEPEVIRMYSSSPPPLDNVADEDEDDEFGEFGGFSGVGNSGIGFADLDAVHFPTSREDFLPSKHFMPIHEYSDNVRNFTSLTSISDKETVSEITTSKKGTCLVFDSNSSNESTQNNIAALDNKGSSAEKAKKSDPCVSSESAGSPKHGQAVDACNGEQKHYPGNLTNGFAAAEDSVNPQGIEALDNVTDSKGFQSSTAHSPDLSIDFPPSPGEEFADFSPLSKVDSVHLNDTELKAHTGSHEGQTSIMLNSTLNRVNCDSNLNNNKELTNVVLENFDDSSDLTSTNNSREAALVADDSVAGDEIVKPNVKISEATTQLADTQRCGLTERCQNGEETVQTTDDIHGFTPDGSFETIQKTIQNSSRGDLSPDATSKNPPLTFTDHRESNDLNVKEQSQLDENDFTDDFGDFEDVNHVPFQDELEQPENISKDRESDYEHSKFASHNESETVNQFGDFDSGANTGDLDDFPESDDFADFSSAVNNDQPLDWKAFDDDQTESAPWSAFESEKTDISFPASESWQSYGTAVPSSDQAINTESVPLPESESTLLSDGTTSSSQQSLLSRFERIIQVCFPPPPISETEEIISSLDCLLQTSNLEERTKSLPSTRPHREVLDVWPELQDIHDAYGLKHQWGGSHSNKKLLCSLGIDTRNILFTGNKKQPVIVPMYAAGLGMLEPTKEPLKPLSAAEKIASIGQSSPVSPDDNICSSVQLQESLPPVQFDWSSSGLTNPLDGVDPELYALTTSKVECSSASNRVTDAFARLMSTAETTSTSARKPRRDENLSEEASKVIASLPELSFMHAKVLMFPATLTPSTSSQDKVD
ncbi:aftiphilin isoform X2 [Spea bombifrons]|uniref:aftiphilin isoform X2 n=1 Tax=Spea bombifrons TaxID=233779 RepID=UPI002349DB4C|nr:aftiphilin isoform X2 [Spea bombifrons]